MRIINQPRLERHRQSQGEDNRYVETSFTSRESEPSGINRGHSSCVIIVSTLFFPLALPHSDPQTLIAHMLTSETLGEKRQTTRLFKTNQEKWCLLPTRGTVQSEWLGSVIQRWTIARVGRRLIELSHTWLQLHGG